MGAIKIKGANFMRKKQQNVLKKDLIKTQRIFPNDVVQVVSGKEYGKQGKVLDVMPKRNLIVVQGVANQQKHLKPNPFYPKGGKILKETPIHYSRVQLVDPLLKKPVKVELKWMQDPEEKRCKLTRFAKETGSIIKIPKVEPKVQSDGPLDTLGELVSKVTFEPNLTECPFPTQLMNEYVRMKRRGKESRAL